MLECVLKGSAKQPSLVELKEMACSEASVLDWIYVCAELFSRMGETRMWRCCTLLAPRCLSNKAAVLQVSLHNPDLPWVTRVRVRVPRNGRCLGQCLQAASAARRRSLRCLSPFRWAAALCAAQHLIRSR